MTGSLYGSQAAVEVLLEFGADVNASNPAKHSAKDIAGHYGHNGIVELLESHGLNRGTTDPR